MPELLGKNALYFKTYDGLKYDYQEINKKIKFIDDNYDSILKEINKHKEKLSLEKMLSNYTRVINEVCPHSHPNNKNTKWVIHLGTYTKYALEKINIKVKIINIALGLKKFSS